MYPIQVAVDNGHPSCAAPIRSWPALCNLITAKLYIDKFKKQVTYETIKDTPNNELTTPKFAFKVIEMMKGYCVSALAGNLVEYVGTRPNCDCALCAQGAETGKSRRGTST